MSKTTAFIIVGILIVFIIIRINIAFKYQDQTREINNFEPDLPTAYTGTLPCASCPGIEYELRLEEGQFTEFSRYTDREPVYSSKTGRWQITGNTLTINAENPQISKRFYISEDSLRLLDIKGEDIAGELAENYRLQRNTEFQSILNQQAELRKNGVRFIGSGNEPFWAFHVLQGDTLLYMEPDLEIKSRSLNINQLESGAEYLAEFSSDHSIEVTLNRAFCQDTMSGFKFTHVVTVTENGVTYTGCGRYL